MARLLQRLLTFAAIACPVLIAAASPKFFQDDPLLRDPKPLPVGKLKTDKLSDSGDFLRETFREPGEKQSVAHPTPSLDTNTLDELPDSLWYTNRHYSKPMTIEELTRGPGGIKPPSTEKPWIVYEAKLEGVTPGFRIKDCTGEKYVIKFDPLDNREMATAADVIGAKFFYALGYNVPDNYPVRFRRDQLRLGENIKFVRQGHKTIMEEADLDHLLSKVPRYPDGSYRGMASRFIAGDILGLSSTTARVRTTPTTRFPTSDAGFCGVSMSSVPGSITPIPAPSTPSIRFSSSTECGLFAITSSISARHSAATA